MAAERRTSPEPGWEGWSIVNMGHAGPIPGCLHKVLVRGRRDGDIEERMAAYYASGFWEEGIDPSKIMAWRPILPGPS
jgi:hypothetical protein